MHPSRLRLGPSQSRPLTDASPGSTRAPGLRVYPAAPSRRRKYPYTRSFSNRMPVLSSLSGHEVNGFRESSGRATSLPSSRCSGRPECANSGRSRAAWRLGNRPVAAILSAPVRPESISRIAIFAPGIVASIDISRSVARSARPAHKPWPIPRFPPFTKTFGCSPDNFDPSSISIVV